MDKQFEKRLARAQNPRVRKHNAKRPQKLARLNSNVAVILNELKEDLAKERRDISMSELMFPSNAEAIGMVTEPLKFVGELGIAAAMDGVEAVKRQLGKKERQRKLEQRRKYYAADLARRAAQREQIRAAQTPPAHPCPTPEALTAAYLHRRDSDECILRFGELMIDLEEHARREFAFTDKKISGSSGGVKDWLKANCPLLAAHYSTCQRYKRLAQEDYAQ